MSVSYTHLDVYKRQLQEKWESGLVKKWKKVKDEYHNINNILNFHRSTMHHKSNMSVNHIIPVIDNLLTKDRCV